MELQRRLGGHHHARVRQPRQDDRDGDEEIDQEEMGDSEGCKGVGLRLGQNHGRAKEAGGPGLPRRRRPVPPALSSRPNWPQLRRRR
eukprot:2014137-Pyramimonas_sp.AAC.1